MLQNMKKKKQTNGTFLSFDCFTRHCNEKKNGERIRQKANPFLVFFSFEINCYHSKVPG